MDKEQIKKALDAFEDDKYTDAKDILKKEIASKRDEFLKNKLELQNDINPVLDKGDAEGEE
jgi:hypothetical protein